MGGAERLMYSMLLWLELLLLMVGKFGLVRLGNYYISRIDMGCGTGKEELAPREVIDKVFELWSTGEFFKNIDHAPDWFAMDCKLDAKADTKNTDMYQEYTGPGGFMDWITNKGRPQRIVQNTGGRVV